MKTMLATVDPSPEAHARWCSGGCPRWVGFGNPTCVPDPCRCSAYKASKPAWGRERCWWTRRNTDRIVSECPCWGRARVEGLPGNCCAHHSANPRYAPPPAPRTLDDLDLAPLLDDWGRPAPRVDVALLDWNGFDPEIEHAPYERRWTREELHCECVTPWDTGWHCAADGCHQNFKSYAVGAVHRRRWTEPCRPPESIVDCDTGEALMYQDGSGVWGARHPFRRPVTHHQRRRP